MIRRIILIAALFSCAGLFLYTRLYHAHHGVLRGQQTMYTKNALLMGTFVEIKVVADHTIAPEVAEQAMGHAVQEIRKVEKIFSRYDKESELSKVNLHAVEKPYEVSDVFMTVLMRAKYFADLTGGSFDVTVAPLEAMIAEAAERNRMPSEVVVNDALGHVGMDTVGIDEANKTVMLHEGMELDFGALAKGYAVDRAIGALKEYGIDSAIVNAGGDMYCLGSGTDEIGWRIGIRHPEHASDRLATLLLRDRAVATSGSYERFHVIEGEEVSHIVNPQTGRPLEAAPLSVTVLDADCLAADALATAVYVLGKEEGIALLDGLPTAEGVIISRNEAGELLIDTSQGLKEIEIDAHE